MRLRGALLLALTCAKLNKVVESLLELEQSLRDEAARADGEFRTAKAGCATETASRQADVDAVTEGLQVITSAKDESTSRLEALEQTIAQKNLEIDEVKSQLDSEREAKTAAREEYEKENEALEKSKGELKQAIAASKKLTLAETGSLSTLRQLSTALIAEAGPPPAAFLQLKAKTKKGSDEEESLDKVMAEQEQLRKDYEVKVAEIGDRIKELEAREIPLERELRKLVPAKASAESEKASSEARSADVGRTKQGSEASLKALEDLCKTSLDSMSQETEMRADVQHGLASAAETLQSAVFTSLVERSAAALDAPSFLQTERPSRRHHHHHHHRSHSARHRNNGIHARDLKEARVFGKALGTAILHQRHGDHGHGHHGREHRRKAAHDEASHVAAAARRLERVSEGSEAGEHRDASRPADAGAVGVPRPAGATAKDSAWPWAPRWKRGYALVDEAPPSFVQLSVAEDPFGDVKARIRALVDQLRSQRNSDVDLVSFCADQDKKFERDQARLKDAVDVEESGIQMHEAQIADLTDAQKDGTTTSAAHSARSAQREANATKAAEAAEKRAKDHGLAREVIGQAAQMVRDLVGVAEQAGVFLQNTPSEAGKTAAAASALETLEVAERTLATMVQNYDASKAALEGKLDALKKADVELTKAQKQELAAIDLMLADHQDQALEAKDAKKTAAKSLEALEAGREEQRAQCLAGDDEKDTQMRKEDELASLQDALKVLDGESVPVVGSFVAQRKVVGKLSPLDAAAVAMGIAVRPA